MSAKHSGLDSLIEVANNFFLAEFGPEPQFASYGPGRVNLIGEHTDYNDGYVLPIALNMATIMVGCKNGLKICRIKIPPVVVEEDNFVEFPVPSDQPLTPGLPSWSNYIKGVVANFKYKEMIVGFDAVVVSEVPLGGGLSSSAAIEVATHTFLEGLTDSTGKVSPKEIALSCQKAEHQFANVPCGIMDQFISVMGERNHALLIDCMELTSKAIQMELADHVFLITNSNVKHKLVSSEFGARRGQCEEAARLLGVKSLRHANLKLLTALEDKMPDVIFRRARHVITENQRTLAAAEALPAGDLVKFGQLMHESHHSLRDDYEVSCPELDELVSTAGEVEGVLGSRMTGGGFGGCTVTLVKSSAVERLKAHIIEKYSQMPTFYEAVPSHGARLIKF